MRTTLLSIIVLLSLSFSLNAQEKDVADILYDAIYAEEISGELDKAAELYNQVLKNHKEDRQACAQALFHLGLIGEKGKKGEMAKGHYKTLINSYAEIGEYARLARGRLQIIEDQNTFIDPRDGHKYKYVEIGDQIWMAENLAYMPHVNPPKKQEMGIWVYDYNGQDVAEAKATENYQKYGCLYDWTTAMDIDPKYLEEEWNGDYENHQGICPPGWRMPSDKDWTELETFFGLSQNEILERDDQENWNLGFYQSCGANKLKSTSGWLSGGNGSNEFSFNFHPGGSRYIETSQRKILQDLGTKGEIWTSSEFADSLGNLYLYEKGRASFSRFFNSILITGQNDDNINRSPDDKTSGFSVRCVKSANPQKSNKLKSYLDQNSNNSIQAPAVEPVYKTYRPELLDTISIHFSGKGGILAVDDMVFIWNPEDTIIACYDSKDFSEKWIRKDFVSRSILDNMMSIYENNGKLTYYNGEQIVILDSRDGKVINSLAFPEVYLNPVHFENIYLLSNRGIRNKLIAISKSDASILWEFSLGDSVSLHNATTDGHSIFLSCRPQTNSSSRGFYPSDSKKHALCAINVENGKIKWTFDSRFSGSTEAPLLVENQIIFVNGDQYVYSFNKDTGTNNWKCFLDHKNTIAPISYQNDMIYLYDQTYSYDKNKAYCISKSGQQEWKKVLNGIPGTLSLVNSKSKYYHAATQNTYTGNHLLFLNVSKHGPDWKIQLPEKANPWKLNIINNYILVPTPEKVYVYKYPDFKE